MSRARRRDRRVYLRSHPVLFALLAAVRRRPVTRFGGTVLVHGADAYREALTRLPLDRQAAGTTGGTARHLGTGDLLFDQEGGAHRGTRRSLADDLGVVGVERLRPVWRAVLDRRLRPLAAGAEVDVTDVAVELAGVTVAALLDLAVDPRLLADAAREAAAAAAHDHLPTVRDLPGVRRLGRGGREPTPGTGTSAGGAAARQAAARLTTLVEGGGHGGPGLAAMLAVAAVNTTVAALPRAVAWCADAGLWADAACDTRRPALAGELFRVLAPAPLLPRVAAVEGAVGGCPVRAGDRLVLVARHAAGGHRGEPDPGRPAPPAVAQLVFGAGAHACPGARLARAQLEDVLLALAPHRPVVVRSRADRRSALPGWASLVVRAGTG